MTAFTARTACTPFALTHVFKEPYDAVCQRIKDAGGNYQSVSQRTAHRVLKKKFTIKRLVNYSKGKIPLRFWAKLTKGTWVSSVVGRYSGLGHCVVVKDGVIFDNGCHGPDSVMQCAWKLQEA